MRTRARVATKEQPKLRHLTMLMEKNAPAMKIIVGHERFELEVEAGEQERFLRVKSLLDGRHTIEEISALTGAPEKDIRQIITQFDKLGILRQERSALMLSRQEFLEQLEATCYMWSRQIGYHPLFRMLHRGEVRKEVFLGLMLETFHYVRSASKVISCAIAHCSNETHRTLLTQYLLDEHNHAPLLVETLKNLGVSAIHTIEAHPVIGTQSLINMLCEIGRTDTLAYLACTALFEARQEDAIQARQAFHDIAVVYGYDPEVVSPILSHLEGDLEAGHTSLIEQALTQEFIPISQAHLIFNSLHDLKHSFDQFHDQILHYYSDISNYIPRLAVDYFSL